MLPKYPVFQDTTALSTCRRRRGTAERLQCYHRALLSSYPT